MGSVALAALLVLSVCAPVAAADESMMNQSTVNHDAGIAQNPRIVTDVTVATHDRATMDSPLSYEDDSGDLAMLPATVNVSEDADDLGTGTVNPLSFVATDVMFEDAYAFPHDSANSWSEADDWTTGSSVTVSNSSTATDVDAVMVNTSGISGGSSATATIGDNVSIDSDVAKRYLAAAIDVDSVDAGTTVELRAVEDDGDYAAVTLVNTSSMASADDVAANATGEGFVVQQQIGQQSVMGSGDGTLAAVDELQVVTMDGDAQLRISMLNAEKIGEYTFGETYVDSDTDDEGLETMTVTEPHGAVETYDLDTMGPAFDDAVIHGLMFPAEFRASDLADEEDVNLTSMNAEGYPSFPKIVTQQYRLELPAAYDLSYSNARIVDEVSSPSNRYQTVGVSEGASDTEFGDLSYTSVKSTFANADVEDEVTLDDTIQPGQQIAVEYEVLATGSENSEVFDTGGGAIMGGESGGSGGIIDGVLDFVIGGVLMVAGWFGVRTGAARYLGRGS